MSQSKEIFTEYLCNWYWKKATKVFPLHNLLIDAWLKDDWNVSRFCKHESKLCLTICWGILRNVNAHWRSQKSECHKSIGTSRPLGCYRANYRNVPVSKIGMFMQDATNKKCACMRVQKSECHQDESRIGMSGKNRNVSKNGQKSECQ